MEPLEGAERLILQTIHDLKGGMIGPVEDVKIVHKVRIPINDIRTYVGTLQEKGYVHLIPTTTGISAEMTLKGIQAVRQWEAILHSPGSVPLGSPPLNHTLPKVTFKGLRAFDPEDAGFFLDLLPGTRGPDGLPECVRFWKYQIEEADPDKTFRVGLLYGPSGCGKTSLMEAGIIPHLAASVISVYVEATGHETESRLLNALRRYCPTLPPKSSLLSTLQKKDRILQGKKILIVLDQFEQWLQANSDAENSELLQALMECDGEVVQCVLMVRADFWIPVSRFLRQLGIQQQEGRNMQMIDLFDPPHAKKVLTAFGQAFRALGNDLSKEQTAFVDQAIAGLAQNGKVICVRLVLFAQMVKGKPWTPASLKAIGGTEGVGFTFLEETFSASTAPPRHRQHLKAVQGVLKALLPESGPEIKGHMRSHVELLEASGYAKRPNDFDDLIRILDAELRLITPTDPEGKEGTEESTSYAQQGQRYYQLTHDYLVPSLRDWLTRKQKETKQGRAELLLADRASIWNARRESSLLPTLRQWIEIRSLTQEKNWIESQKKMMQVAAQYHAERVLKRLFNASTQDVPRIVEDMGRYRGWINELICHELNEVRASQDARKQLHASLALLPVDAGQTTYLLGRLFGAKLDEIPIIRDALTPYKGDLEEALWSVLVEPSKEKASQRLRAASALAKYNPDSERWVQVQDQVANDFLGQPTLHAATWIELLRPVGGKLLGAFGKAFRDGQRKETERSLATDILADYAADSPTFLAELVMDADVQQFAVIFPKFKEQGERGLPVLTGEIDKKLLSDLPPSDEHREKLAKRQANAAVALLKMNQPAENIWPLLKHSPDPRVRSYLINRLGPLGADGKAIINRLNGKMDITIRRALILSLGEFDEEKLPPEDRQRLAEELQVIFRTDTDPGLHAASEWLLRTWKQEAWLKQKNKEWAKDQEQRDKRLEIIGKTLVKKKVQAPPQWYINGQGQTMVVIPGPVEFVMGSPPTEFGRRASEIQHKKRISRSFALAAKAVTVEQFWQFANRQRNTEQYAPTPDCPMIEMSWYDAAEYCNWLSGKEGIPSDDWCYETEKGEVTQLKAKYLSLKGYRLPTEAEMEYAIRAGAMTSFYYGETEELLPKYAWYLKNSNDRTWPVGSLMPNDLGLFDMHGNVFCWCQESKKSYPAWQGDEVAEDKEDDLVIVSTSPRGLRGGSFNYPASILRSANCFVNVPTRRVIFFNYGFRVARTFAP